MWDFYKNKDLENSSVPLQTEITRHRLWQGRVGCSIVNFLNEATLYYPKSHLEYEQQRFTSV